MPVDKAKKIQRNSTNISQVDSFNEPANVASGAISNIVPLEHAKQGLDAMQESKQQKENGEIPGAAVEPQDEATSEIKTRVEGVLSRIRSDVAASDTGTSWPRFSAIATRSGAS